MTRAMARLVSELKITKVSPHDLRRTVGTEMAKLGLPTHVRSRYACDREKREALGAWEGVLARLLASGSGLSH